MGIFNKTKKDVDSYYERRMSLAVNDYWRLAQLIKKKDLSISERAKNVLCKLANDEDAISNRTKWPFNHYKFLLSYLESGKFSSYKNEIAPLINVLRSERNMDIYERVNSKFQHLGANYVEEIAAVFQHNESIEYEKILAPNYYNIVVTNKRIIAYRIFLSGGVRLIMIDYDHISSINHGFIDIKIESDKGAVIKFPNDAKELMSHLAKYIPKKNTNKELENQLEKFNLMYIIFNQEKYESLNKKLDQNEKIEFGKRVSLTSTVDNVWLITNKKMIIYGAPDIFVPISYDAVNSIKHGPFFIKIEFKKGTDKKWVKIPNNEKDLITHIAKYIPKLNDYK